MQKVYTKIDSIVGNVITVRATGVRNSDLAEVTTSTGKSYANVIKLDGDRVSLQVFSAGQHHGHIGQKLRPGVDHAPVDGLVPLLGNSFCLQLDHQRLLAHAQNVEGAELPELKSGKDHIGLQRRHQIPPLERSNVNGFFQLQ